MTSGPEQPVPVASLTKLMTAYVILHDHPLAPDESGPHITVTQADVDDYDTDTVSDDSNAQVTARRAVDRAQVLEGLLVHSADNYADMLARWDAGSVPAFVAKMNAAAAHARHAPVPLRRPERRLAAVDVDGGRHLEGGGGRHGEPRRSAPSSTEHVGHAAGGGHDLHVHAAAGAGRDHRGQVRLHDGGRRVRRRGRGAARARPPDAPARRRHRPEQVRTRWPRPGCTALALVNAVQPLIGTTTVLRGEVRGPRRRGGPAVGGEHDGLRRRC